MLKISMNDNMRIQTLHELGLGYRRIILKFPFFVTLMIDFTYVCCFASLTRGPSSG